MGLKNCEKFLWWFSERLTLLGGLRLVHILRFGAFFGFPLDTWAGVWFK